MGQRVKIALTLAFPSTPLENFRKRLLSPLASWLRKDLGENFLKLCASFSQKFLTGSIYRYFESFILEKIDN